MSDSVSTSYQQTHNTASPSSSSSSSAKATQVPKVLTVEQLARIEENRQKALAKRNLAESLRQVNVVNEELERQDKEEQEALKHKSETTNCTMILENGDLCGKCPVDHDLCEYFNEMVCKSCKFNAGNTYKTISRSECMATYLISEESMKVLKFMSKDNPHHPGWTPMKLYLRKHVMAMAVERFGSLEALELERKKRESSKFERNLTKTDDILAKQSAIYRGSMHQSNMKEGDIGDEETIGSPLTANKKIVSNIDNSDSKASSNKKRDVGSISNSKGGLNAKRRRMVSDFLSCLK